MGWMFLKTTVFICLVLPRISSSHPTQFHQLQYEQQQEQQQQQQYYQEDQESVARQFNDYSPEEIGRALDTFYVPASYRQSGGGGGGGGSLGTIIELAVKFLPLIMSTFSGAGGSGSSSASSSSPALAASPSTNSVDRIETIDIKDDEDNFSWQNMISVGLKLFLTLLSSSDGIDKSDSFPTQALLGTAISAITGSTNPAEVAKMAKQATEVISLVTTLFEALQTSFSS